jgi:hypothetical protein
MTTTRLPVQEAETSVHRHLGGMHAIWCGSSVAALDAEQRHPGMFTHAYHDIDIFNPSMGALMANVQHLLNQGAVPADEEEGRKLKRWMMYGSQGWHTNSVRLEAIDGFEYNLVFKTIDKHALRTPLDIVNSFDFSNLGVSFDLRTGERRDLRDYYWPDDDKDRVRLLPDREQQWLTGSIGKFTGLRQAGRYATNAARGYDMELVKAPLVQGYRIVAAHYMDKDDQELQEYGGIYLDLADHIEQDFIEELLAAYAMLNPRSRAESLHTALRGQR